MSVFRPLARSLFVALGCVAAACAQGGGTTTFSVATSFTQTVHLTQVNQQVDTFLTRIVGRINAGATVYDQSFNLPFNDPIVKLHATVPVGGTCTGSAADPNATATSGTLAWGTTVHLGTTTNAITETAFLPATLSAGELTRLKTLCSLINANGSGFGICRSCRLGGLGSGRL